MSWRFLSPAHLLEQVRLILSNIDLVPLTLQFLTIEVETDRSEKKREKASSGTGECPLPLVGNIMLFTMMLARMQVPTGSGSSLSASFSTTVLCGFVSLAIWSVAVVGLHHLRSNHDTPSTSAVPGIWTPEEANNNPHYSSWQIQSSFRLDLSTEDNYQAVGSELGNKPTSWQGPFAEIRQGLDYKYHKVYTPERQMFQDSLVLSMLQPSHSSQEAASASGACSVPHKANWIVFTAGAMGAGKSFTMKQLHEKGVFPLDEFVTVDPDGIRRHLPEFEQYVQHDPEKAGYHTRKEAGLISEILTEAALQRGQSVLVDGTLRNSTWHKDHFASLRKRYPRLQIGIVHVTAPRESVLERAMSRAKVTGRVVPTELLERVMVEVPRSIAILKKLVDFAVELRNPPDTASVEIATDGITWESFKRNWKQSCSLEPSSESVEVAQVG